MLGSTKILNNITKISKTTQNSFAFVKGCFIFECCSELECYDRITSLGILFVNGIFKYFQEKGFWWYQSHYKKVLGIWRNVADV